MATNPPTNPPTGPERRRTLLARWGRLLDGIRPATDADDVDVDVDGPEDAEEVPTVPVRTRGRTATEGQASGRM